MECCRIISRLDIKEKNLVKGVGMEGLRVLGKAYSFAEYYYNNGCDELYYQDVVASLYGRNSLYDDISRTSKNIFIPLIVGGGIRNVNDIVKVLQAGADRVSINTAAVKNPNFITEAAEKFGSSTIIISIDAIKQKDNTFLVYTDNTRSRTSLELSEWAQIAESKGAGELIITLVDHEGRGKGLGTDIDYLSKISKKCRIPIIINGGLGNVNHIIQCIKKTDIRSFSIASIFHYNFIKNQRKKKLSEFSEGNIDFLLSRKKYMNFDLTSPIKLKKILKKKNFLVNL
jgi:cyclase